MPVERDPDEYDFFVSYARKDNAEGWVTGFVDQLLDEHKKFAAGRELKPFFDMNAIRAGDDWEHTLHHGIAKSRLFLAFISPNYFASEWCLKEWRVWIDTEIAKHILTLGATPIYLVEIPGLTDGLDEQEVAEEIADLCGLPIPHDAFQASAAPIVRQVRRRQMLCDFVEPFEDEGLNALRREDLRKTLESLASNLDERTRRVSDAANSESTVPAYNKNFTGRADELMDLRKRLTDDRAGVICGVHGLGGIGKSELAFTYAHAFAYAYPGGRFLIECDGRSDLRQAALQLGDFKDFRAQISNEERRNPQNYFVTVTRCLDLRLEGKGHILLVLDNVTDADLVSAQQTDALTALGPKLHLLATTRLLPPAAGQWITLGELTPEEALLLLEKHRAFENDNEREAAETIVKRLGGFTLAIELMAAWLAAHPASCSYTSMANGLGLEDLENIAGDADVKLRRHNQEKRLTAVLTPVLEGLTAPQIRALEYAALLPPDHVALPWLQALVEADFPEEMQPTRLIADPWAELVHQLFRLSLFIRVEGESSEPKLARVHRLIQDIISARLLDKRLLQDQVEKHILHRAKHISQRRGWGTPGAEWEIQVVTECAFRLMEKDNLVGAKVASLVSTALVNRGAYVTAEHLIEKGKLQFEQTAGHNHPSFSLLLCNLSGVNRELGRFKEAERLIDQAISIDRELGDADLSLARDLNSLGLLHHAQNKFIEAEDAYRESAVFANKPSKTSQERNEIIAVVEHNLADLFRSTGKMQKSIESLKDSIILFESALGHYHSHVAAAHNNLAVTFQELGKLRDAEEHFRVALRIFGNIFEADHIKVATIAGHLALCLLKQGRAGESRRLFRQCIEVLSNFKEATNFEHPFLPLSYEGYATALIQCGRSRVEIERLLTHLGWDGRITFFRLLSQNQRLVWLRKLFQANPLISPARKVIKHLGFHRLL